MEFFYVDWTTYRSLHARRWLRHVVRTRVHNGKKATGRLRFRTGALYSKPILLEEGKIYVRLFSGWPSKPFGSGR
jgi:hypothetical protein